MGTRGWEVLSNKLQAESTPSGPRRHNHVRALPGQEMSEYLTSVDTSSSVVWGSSCGEDESDAWSDSTDGTDKRVSLEGEPSRRIREDQQARGQLYPESADEEFSSSSSSSTGSLRTVHSRSGYGSASYRHVHDSEKEHGEELSHGRSPEGGSVLSDRPEQNNVKSDSSEQKGMGAT